MEALISYPHTNPTTTTSNIFHTSNNNQEKHSTHHLLSSFQASPNSTQAKAASLSPLLSQASNSSSVATTVSPLTTQQTNLLSPQMQNSIYSQYPTATTTLSSPSSQHHLSAASLAAAAHLAAEMHQNQYNTYQQNQFDFLKMFTPSVSIPHSSSPNMNASNGSNFASIFTSNNTGSPPTASNMLHSPHSADKLLGSTSASSLNGILSNSNIFMPANDDSSFYNAMSASFVGRLASEHSSSSHIKNMKITLLSR